MDPFVTKLLMAAVLFIFGFAGGTIPRMLATSKRGETLLTLGGGFAGGVFLGAGTIHLLGDSHEFFAQATGGAEYPYFLLVGGVGFLLILFLEKVLVSREETEAASGSHPFVLLIVLSLHSFIAGTALGLETETAAAIILLVAILAHKSFAAFALGSSFQEHGLARRRYFALLSIFAIMTPLGVMLGAGLSSVLQSQTALEFEAIFDGLAGGTFIYVASMDVIGHTFDDARLKRAKFAAIALGFALMALLAIWS